MVGCLPPKKLSTKSRIGMQELKPCRCLSCATSVADIAPARGRGDRDTDPRETKKTFQLPGGAKNLPVDALSNMATLFQQEGFR